MSVPVTTATTRLPPARAKLVTLMRQTLADRSHWRYVAVRPQQIPPSWKPGQHVDADCSDGVRMLCRWAGIADDPAGNHYGPFGNSSSIWLHCHHVSSPGQLEVGDIVVFGWAGKDHAGMVMEAGSNPQMWSDGHPGAPNTYPLSQDTRVKTYCKIGVADLPPTPQALLRAHTDFWSWMAWQLGEGPWRHYGPYNATVRPNVGRVIAVSHPTWWARRKAFISARHTGDKPTTS